MQCGTGGATTVAVKQKGRPPLLLDLANRHASFQESDLAGEKLVLVCGSEEVGNGERMSISWGGLAAAVDPDDVVYLADGAIRLRVRSVRIVIFPQRRFCQRQMTSGVILPFMTWLW